MLWIILAVATALARPDPTVTPGAVRALTRETVCATVWGLDARHVSAARRRAVFDRYGVPAATRVDYIVDHLIPRELAGDDGVDNLWPQPRREAHLKDRDENRLHHDVCAGRISLDAAQAQMRAWGQ